MQAKRNMDNSALYYMTVYRLSNACLKETEDMIAEEMPVALVYNGISHVVLMATPQNLAELALGFSLSEGILAKAGELYDVEVRTGAKGVEVHMEIAAARFATLKERRRNMSGRTGCGLCGIDSLAAVMPDIAPVRRTGKTDADQIDRVLQQFDDFQPLRKQTGALHAAAWVEEGEIRQTFEDIGRHNALDKLLGHLAKNNIDRAQGWVLVSSRASYEMVAKAAKLGIGCLVAVSAPTAMAIRLADAANLTLIGFARAGRQTVYTHAEFLNMKSSSYANI